MIPDGYTFFGELSGFAFEYRPLPAPHRVILGRRLKEAPESLRMILVHETIRERLAGAIPPEMTPQEAQALLRIVSGVEKAVELQEAEHNLRRGVRLLSVAPWTQSVSCNDCREWAFSPLEGRFQLDIHGSRMRQGGPVTCEFSDKCPVGHYARQRRLSQRNLDCVRHYFECSATSFPDDPYVRHNARVIEYALKQAQVDVGRID